MLCYAIKTRNAWREMKGGKERGKREGGRKMGNATESQEPPCLILIDSPFPFATAKKVSHPVDRATESAISSIPSSPLVLPQRKHNRRHSHSIIPPSSSFRRLHSDQPLSHTRIQIVQFPLHRRQVVTISLPTNPITFLHFGRLLNRRFTPWIAAATCG